MGIHSRVGEPKKLGASFKMRECMNPSCKKKFLSSGAHHRLCENCRKKETSPFDDTHTVYI